MQQLRHPAGFSRPIRRQPSIQASRKSIQLCASKRQAPTVVVPANDAGPPAVLQATLTLLAAGGLIAGAAGQLTDVASEMVARAGGGLFLVGSVALAATAGAMGAQQATEEQDRRTLQQLADRVEALQQRHHQQLEAAQRDAAATRELLAASQGHNAAVEKLWQRASAASIEAAKENKSLRGQHRKMQTALGRAHAQAAVREVELQAAQRQAIAAQEQLAVAQGRGAVLEKAWAAAFQEAKALRGQQRALQATLSKAQHDVAALSSQLDQASALIARLEEAQREAETAKATAKACNGRSAALEQQQRTLQSAVRRVQAEASALAAQLNDTQRDAAAAKKLLQVSKEREGEVERAFAAAVQQVRSQHSLGPPAAHQQVQLEQAPACATAEAETAAGAGEGAGAGRHDAPRHKVAGPGQGAYRRNGRPRASSSGDRRLVGRRAEP